MKKVLIVILPLLLFGCVSKGIMNLINADIAFSNAEKEIKDGDCELAKQHIDEAIKVKPKDEQILELRKKIEHCIKENKENNFQSHLQRAAMLNPYDLNSILTEYWEALALNINNSIAQGLIDRIEDHLTSVKNCVSSITAVPTLKSNSLVT